MNESLKKQYEDLRQVTSRFLVSAYIKDILAKDKTFVLDVKELITSIHSPSELDDILEEMMWVRDDFDENGWQQDTWYYYSHPDYDFELVMSYSGFYGGLKLYRRDIDDE